MGLGHPSSLHEVEEESNPNVNNGLPRVRYFEDITSKVGEVDQFFFMLQMTAATVHKRNVAQKGQGSELAGAVSARKYKIDAMLNHVVFFYNRMLISRAQTFFHQATVGKTLNAQAEADFDSKMSALMTRTEAQVTDLLEKSEFEMACALKGVELLVPDDVNFQESKFFLLQTGNVVARSRQHQTEKLSQRNHTDGLELGPQMTSLV